MSTCSKTGKVVHRSEGAAWKSLQTRRDAGVLGLDWNVYACGSHFHTGHRPGSLTQRIRCALGRSA